MKRKSKIDSIKIPFTPNEPDVFESDIKALAEQDSSQVNDLIKQNKIEELKDLIDKRMLPFEQKYSDSAGLATRDYIENLLGKSVLDKYPDIAQKVSNSRYDAGLTSGLAKEMHERVYPGVDNVKEFGTQLEDNGQFSRSGEIKINPNLGDYKKISTMLHESGHAFDDKISNDPKKNNELAAKKAAYESIINSPSIRASSEEGSKPNVRSSNLSDYDWEQGRFNSDYIKSPSELQDEDARGHHRGRNYPLDNLINVNKDGLDSVVDSGKFSKIKKAIS